MFYKKHRTGSDYYYYVAIIRIEQLARRDSAGSVRVKLYLSDDTEVDILLSGTEYEKITSGITAQGFTINP